MSRPTIRRGSKRHDHVEHAQVRLSSHGYRLEADGSFGQQTHDAVRQFQAGAGLSSDGIIGPNTWYALDRGSEAKPSLTVLSKEKKALVDRIPASLRSRRRTALEWAIYHLGADEVPDGSNWGNEIQSLVEGYNEFWRTRDSVRYPWCAMFCSTCIGVGYGAGSASKSMAWAQTPMEKFFGGAAQFEEWAKKYDLWVPSSVEEAPSGSLFTMARGGSSSDPSKSARAGHVGFVICDNGNGTVTTIEGNVSNGVRSRTRNKSDLHGFIAWWDR
jgi:hypothetical protein